MSFEINFSEGAKIICHEGLNFPIRVEFWNDSRNEIEYRSSFSGPGVFSTPKKYFIPWRVKVFEGETQIYEEIMDLKGKRVFVHIDSPSIGDTLAWVSQALRFGRKHECELTIFNEFSFLFKEEYPEVSWVHAKHNVVDPYARYRISYWLSPQRFYFNPVDPRTSPLAKVASDILGMEYAEERPRIQGHPSFTNPLQGKKYVCIGTTSTAGAKEWNFEGGWQRVVDYLRSLGYEVAVVQKEPTELEGIVDLSGGNFPLERSEVLRQAQFFVGLPSGMSWLSWAVGTPVVMISGFSAEFAEFEQDCYRVVTPSSCRFCWNDTKFSFDKFDWNWCPRKKGTEEQFVCTKEITPDLVREKIDLLRSEKKINLNGKTKKKSGT